jgi:hypothetical protein
MRRRREAKKPAFWPQFKTSKTGYTQKPVLL